MASALGDAAMVKHQDLVGIHHRGKSVSDY